MSPSPQRPTQADGDGWRDIASAPKDGSVIMVTHTEVGSFLMAWNPIGTNFLFAPGEIGIWEAPDRSMTWRAGEDGPSHWKPLNQPSCAICAAPNYACDHPELVAQGITTPEGI